MKNRQGIRRWKAKRYQSDSWVVTSEKRVLAGTNRTKCSNRQKPKKRK